MEEGIEVAVCGPKRDGGVSIIGEIDGVRTGIYLTYNKRTGELDGRYMVKGGKLSEEVVPNFTKTVNGETEVTVENVSYTVDTQKLHEALNVTRSRWQEYYCCKMCSEKCPEGLFKGPNGETGVCEPCYRKHSDD